MEKRFLKDVLENCQAEFEELSHEKEWFCTKTIDLIEEALQMLQERNETPQGQ